CQCLLSWLGGAESQGRDVVAVGRRRLEARGLIEPPRDGVVDLHLQVDAWRAIRAGNLDGPLEDRATIALALLLLAHTERVDTGAPVALVEFQPADEPPVDLADQVASVMLACLALDARACVLVRAAKSRDEDLGERVVVRWRDRAHEHIMAWLLDCRRSVHLHVELGEAVRRVDGA